MAPSTPVELWPGKKVKHFKSGAKGIITNIYGNGKMQLIMMDGKWRYTWQGAYVSDDDTEDNDDDNDDDCPGECWQMRGADLTPVTTCLPSNALACKNSLQYISLVT